MTEGLFSLAGRAALVVGGGRGIGAAVAHALAGAGARVTLAGRSRSSLDDATARMAAAGLACTSVLIDVTDGSSVDESVRSLAAAGRSPDILVNAAGISPVYKRAELLGQDDWDAVIATNLTGMFRTCVAFGRGMLERGSGSIVNVLSVGAAVGLPRLAAYSASKSGALGLTRTLAIEWAERGVRVNGIAPAFIKTDMTAGLMANEHLASGIVASTPMGRFDDALDVAGAAVYLASDAARFVTGSTLFVDGGWTAR